MMNDPLNDRLLSISIDLGGIDADILLDYLNETPRGIRLSSYGSHTHSVEELYFIQVGSLTIELADEIITLYEGDLLLISPKTVHRVVACSDDIQRFNLRFTLNTPENILPENPPPWILHHPEDTERAELAFAVNILRRSWEKVYPLEFCRLKAYYAILLSRALEQLIPQYSDAVPERQNHLVRHVHIDSFFSRTHEQLTLEDLAKTLSYSPAQTRRILKDYYGMSFTEKLHHARRTRAEQMLIAGASRKEIAAACGFTTRQGFDAFLRRCGLLLSSDKTSPKETEERN